MLAAVLTMQEICVILIGVVRKLGRMFQGSMRGAAQMCCLGTGMAAHLVNGTNRFLVWRGCSSKQLTEEELAHCMQVWGEPDYFGTSTRANKFPWSQPTSELGYNRSSLALT